MKAIGKRISLPAIFRLRGAASIFALAAIGATASAQSALLRDVEGRGAPGGSPVISLRAGTKVAEITTRGASVLVGVEGWVDASRLAGKIDSFPASVDPTQSLRVHSAASATAATVAELMPRTGVHTLGKSGIWMRIERKAWIPGSALHPVVAPATPPVAPPAAAPRVAPSSVAPPTPAAESVSAAPAMQGALSVSRPVKLMAAPSGSAVGELARGTIVQSLVRDHGFVKVRVEGWVPERDVEPADGSFGPQLSAADLRANPEATRGKSVRWDVEILALQVGDALRRELAPDEPYLLARGPGSESALLYLAVPPSLLNQAKALPPLTRVLITATVRSGRSEPVGTPILDLKSISKR